MCCSTGLRQLQPAYHRLSTDGLIREMLEDLKSFKAARVWRRQLRTGCLVPRDIKKILKVSGMECCTRRRTDSS